MEGVARDFWSRLERLREKIENSGRETESDPEMKG